MKLSDYFDKTFIIGSLNSPKVEHTINCFKKLGIYDDSIMFQTYIHCNDIHLRCGEIIPKDFDDGKTYKLSLCLTQYSLVKHAYEAGLNSILILEDDNYILNDIDKWEEVFNNLPDDWNVIRFTGFFVNNKTKYFDFDNVFEEYNIDYDNMWSSSGFALDRNGMKAYIESQESCMRPADHVNDVFITSKIDIYKLYHKTHVYNDKLKIYVPKYSLLCPIDDIEKYRTIYKDCNNYVEINYADYI